MVLAMQKGASQGQLAFDSPQHGQTMPDSRDHVVQASSTSNEYIKAHTNQQHVHNTVDAAEVSTSWSVAKLWCNCISAWPHVTHDFTTH